MLGRAGPLLVLGDRLRALGPPSLSSLLARLEDAEEYEEFIRLIREFLPEREADIRRAPNPPAQVAAFADYFTDRYFPLEDMVREGNAEGYGDLTRGIPIILQSVSYDDYRFIPQDWRPGYQLLTYIVESPWDDGGQRVALAEACEQIVPAALLQGLPPDGVKFDEVIRLFDRTRHHPVAAWARILFHDTGNCFLDYDYEELSYSTLPDWTRDEVDVLTRSWREAEAIHQETGREAEWLEGDPVARFTELVNYIDEGGAPHEPDPRQLRLPLGFAGGPGSPA